MNVEERLLQILQDYGLDEQQSTLLAAILLEQFDITSTEGRRSVLWQKGRNVWSTEWLRPVVKLVKK